MIIGKTPKWLDQATTKQFRLELCKILVGCLFFTSFFLQSNSLWFLLTFSTLIGCSYYLLSETQPQLTMIISMLVTYQINKISEKIKKFFNWTVFNTSKDDKVRLQFEDNFNSLVYYDSQRFDKTLKRKSEKIKAKNELKKYIFLFKEQLRSNDLIIFKDEFDNDITDDIDPYLGPMQNFHGSRLTPADFNHKQIKVFRDGEINLCKTFYENDVISFG